jgi:hypothetical protein
MLDAACGRSASCIHPAFSRGGLNYKSAIAIPFGLGNPL